MAQVLDLDDRLPIAVLPLGVALRKLPAERVVEGEPPAAEELRPLIGEQRKLLREADIQYREVLGYLQRTNPGPVCSLTLLMRTQSS